MSADGNVYVCMHVDFGNTTAIPVKAIQHRNGNAPNVYWVTAVNMRSTSQYHGDHRAAATPTKIVCTCMIITDIGKTLMILTDDI